MPQYLYQVAYTPESLAAQIKNPQDRMEIVGKQIADAVGAKILGAMSPAMRLPCSQPHGCEQAKGVRAGSAVEAGADQGQGLKRPRFMAMRCRPRLTTWPTQHPFDPHAVQLAAHAVRG